MDSPVEQIRARYPCSCSLCERQSKGKIPFSSVVVTNNGNPEGTTRSYTWLLEKLGDSGLSLNIPDTVVIRQRKPCFFVGLSKDKSLRLVSNKSKMHISEIRKIFISNSVKPQQEVALVRYMTTDNKHSPILPYEENGLVRIMNATEVSHLLDERPGNPVWKSLNFIQSALDTGISQSVSFTFNEQDLTQKTENSTYGLYNDSEEFCRDECRKIAQLLKKLKIKLLMIKPEFMADTSGTLWLVNTTDILVTDEKPKKKNTFGRKKITTNEKPCKHEIELSNKMTEYYETIKKNIGLPERLLEYHTDFTQKYSFYKPTVKRSISVADHRHKAKEIHTATRQFIPTKKTYKKWVFRPSIKRPVKLPRLEKNLPSRSTSRILFNSPWF